MCPLCWIAQWPGSARILPRGRPCPHRPQAGGSKGTPAGLRAQSQDEAPRRARNCPGNHCARTRTRGGSKNRLRAQWREEGFTLPLHCRSREVGARPTISFGRSVPSSTRATRALPRASPSHAPLPSRICAPVQQAAGASGHFRSRSAIRAGRRRSRSSQGWDLARGSREGGEALSQSRSGAGAEGDGGGSALARRSSRALPWPARTPEMHLHQVLTGAVNPGDNCYSVGSVGDVPFTVSGVQEPRGETGIRTRGPTLPVPGPRRGCKVLVGPSRAPWAAQISGWRGAARGTASPAAGVGDYPSGKRLSALSKRAPGVTGLEGSSPRPLRVCGGGRWLQPLKTPERPFRTCCRLRGGEETWSCLGARRRCCAWLPPALC